MNFHFSKVTHAKRRVLGLLLSLVMMLTSVSFSAPLTAFAEASESGGTTMSGNAQIMGTIRINEMQLHQKMAILVMSIVKFAIL